MNKKIFLMLVMLSLLLTACGAVNSTNSPKLNKQPSSMASKPNTAAPKDSAESSSAASTPKASTKNSTDAATSKDGSNNIKNITGFTPIENQSFMVNLNSWAMLDLYRENLQLVIMYR